MIRSAYNFLKVDNFVKFGLDFHSAGLCSCEEKMNGNDSRIVLVCFVFFIVVILVSKPWIWIHDFSPLLALSSISKLRVIDQGTDLSLSLSLARDSVTSHISSKRNFAHSETLSMTFFSYRADFAFLFFR